MCGIFALLNNKITFESNIVEAAFDKGDLRGPEDSRLQFGSSSDIITLGFKRLAINGLDIESGQPLTIDNITLICNGEIYNYRELYKQMNIIPQTNSDCEAIIHLYKLYGIEQTLMMLDGYFSFILYDFQNALIPKVFVARDPFGVRPLFILEHDNNANNSKISNNKYITNETIFGFASELKMLNPLLNSKKGLLKYSKLHIPYPKHVRGGKPTFTISQFPSGCYSTYTKSEHSEWYSIENKISYYSSIPPASILIPFSHDIHSKTLDTIYRLLNNAVKKRVLGTTERPIGCLLSGGLDSSIITALVKQHYKGTLKTFSIGMAGSEDLKYAKIVSEYLKTEHTEIVLTPEEFFDAIPEVIKTIESYDTTTVRASVGNYLIGKYISENTDIKVVFNGDGSDEVTGGYLYFKKAPDAIEFDRECRRLISNIHYFDGLRSDRCISAHGLECRTPFLDRTFVNYYFSIPLSLRYPQNLAENLDVIGCKTFPSATIEKMLLRQAILSGNVYLLPHLIIDRQKEAFSDGVSGDAGSWYSIISEKLSVNKDIFAIDILADITDMEHNTPTTQEQLYYRKLYDGFYPHTAHSIPYFWMPKYVNATDSSARTLDIYNEYV